MGERMRIKAWLIEAPEKVSNRASRRNQSPSSRQSSPRSVPSAPIDSSAKPEPKPAPKPEPKPEPKPVIPPPSPNPVRRGSPSPSRKLSKSKQKKITKSFGPEDLEEGQKVISIRSSGWGGWGPKYGNAWMGEIIGYNRRKGKYMVRWYNKGKETTISRENFILQKGRRRRLLSPLCPTTEQDRRA